MKFLSDLTESEVLALAIANEEEDSRIYQSFAGKLRNSFPASARVFEEMAEEERAHRASLYDVYRERFGEHLPPIRREDVRGFLKRRSIWMLDNLTPERLRKEAEERYRSVDARRVVRGVSHAPRGAAAAADDDRT